MSYRGRHNKRRPRWPIAVVTLVALLGGALGVGQAFAADSGIPSYLTNGLVECQAQLTAAQSRHAVHEIATATDCVTTAQWAIDDWSAAHPQPTPTATPSASATPTVAPTTTAPTTTAAPSPTPTTTAPVTSWPDGSNTGVPPFATLTAYTGPCVITAANTIISNKTITCDQLSIQAAGVIVTRSTLTGGGDPLVQVAAGVGDLIITDSTLSVAIDKTGITDQHWIGRRLNISGGNRGTYCSTHCTLEDSWVHGTRVTDPGHASAVRAEQYTTYRHNRLSCDLGVDRGNCSADVTMYADFAPVHDVLIQDNLLTATNGGYCAYGGDSQTKPYSGDATNATNITFQGNVFQRGTQKSDHGLYVCGYYGSIAAFNASRSGNVWTNNRFDDGVLITP